MRNSDERRGEERKEVRRREVRESVEKGRKVHWRPVMSRIKSQLCSEVK